MKRKVVVRLHSLPDAAEIKIMLPKCKHKNKFISFGGTVTKAFNAKMVDSIKRYNCTKCGMEIEVFIDYGHEDIILPPTKCNNAECNSTFFGPVKSES